MRASVLSLACLALVGSMTLTGAQGGQFPRLIFLSLDGGGAELVDEAMRLGDMPELTRLAARGVRAEHAVPSFPAKTAVGHATLWTGAPPAIHGVAGNRTDPMGLAEPWASVGGFDGRALRAIPVYAHMARHGLRVLALNCSHSSPPSLYARDGRLGEDLGDRLSIVDAFDLPFGPDGTWMPSKGLVPVALSHWKGALPQSERGLKAWRSEWAGRPWTWLSVADAASTSSGYDAIWGQAEATTRHAAVPTFSLPAVAAQAPGLCLPQAWSKALEVAPDAFAYLRLFGMDAATGAPLIFHTAPSRVNTNRPQWLADLRFAGGGFAPGMGGHSYHYGGFGPTLAGGGSGLAEGRYLESLTFSNQLQLAAIRHLLQGQNFDAVFTYLPLPDQVEHQWTGYMQAGPAHRKDLADALRPYWRAAFRLADQAVGQLQALNPQGITAVASDHGMAGIAWDFRGNVVLRDAGLLFLNAQAQVDPQRSLVSIPPHLGPALRVHERGRFLGGQVPPQQLASALSRAKAALMALHVKTPQGLRPLITKWVDGNSQEARSLGLARGISAVFDLQPGYGIDGEASGVARFVARPPNGVGNHLHDPRRRDMHAIFMAAGPGLRQSWVAPALRLEDVAPSLLLWLGLPPMAQARGVGQIHWLDRPK